jgi:hypothetical protein
MGRKGKIIVLLIAAAMLAALAAGCGSSGSSSSSGSTASTGTTSTAGSTSSSGESGGTGNTAASTAFLKPGVKSKIPKFGEEASVEEREAASEVLEENLQAREDAQWTTQCESLSAAAVEKVEGAPTASTGVGCAKNLENQAEPLSSTKEIRANTMTEPIAALRVKGSKGYALYHGAKGVDYAMAMEKEGDEWKVASLVTEEIK